MSIHCNLPDLSWVTLKGIIVTYDNKTYLVEDFKTNLKFVYWDFNIPNKLSSSNINLDQSSTKFNIGINIKGNYTEVPLTNVGVSYDGNSSESTKTRIHGLYEKTSKHDDQFVSVEENINGIKQTVGKWSEDNGTISEKISKIDQRADEVNLSVTNIDKTYKYDELKNNVNKNIIDLNAALGLFYSNSLDYFRDESISQEDKQNIKAEYDLIIDRKNKLFIYVDDVVKRLDDNLESEKSILVNNSKNELNISINNLKTNIDNVIADNIITPSDRTLIINSFSDSSLKLNSLKSVIDSAIVLGLGGSISESLSKINMKSNEISLSVESKVDTKKIISAINLSPEQITISSSKIDISGVVTFSDLSTPGNTTIVGDNITSGTITGVTIISQAQGAKAIMTADGIRFHSPSTQSGKIAYDDNGKGTSDEAKNRLLIESSNGYAMKLNSSGDMSISVADGKTIFMDKTRVIGDLISDKSITTHLEVNDGKALYCDYSGNFHIAKDSFMSESGSIRSAFRVNSTSGDCACVGTFYTANLVYMDKSSKIAFNTSSYNDTYEELDIDCFDIINSFDTYIYENTLCLKSNNYNKENPCLVTNVDGDVGINQASVIASLLDCVKELKNEINLLKEVE